jgi:hypothetical protein
MKKYHLFAGSYYPSGGMGDHQGCFDTEEEAMNKLRKLQEEWFKPDWWHIAIADGNGNLIWG